MTTDKDREREVSKPSEAPAMAHGKVMKVKGKSQEWDEPMSPNRPKS